MTRTLPEQIVAVLSALAEDLGDWGGQGQDRTLAEHEAAVLERVRRVLPLLLRAVVEVSTSGLQPRLARGRQPCPQCRTLCGPQGRSRARQVATQCGVLELERPWYHCRRCGRGWSVTETVLGLQPRARVSAGLQAWLVQLGASAPFREAAEVLEALTGLALGAETLRRYTEQAGAALRAAEGAAVAQVERTREAAEPLAVAPGRLVVETDGAMVRYQSGWHEVKLGLLGGWQQGRLQAPSYVAAREPAERFGPRLAAEAARRGALEIERWEGGVVGRGLAVLPEAVVLGDGAVWIWHLAAEHFGRGIEIVDFYHAAEHLWALAEAFYGPGSAKAKRWAERQAHRLKSQGPRPLLRALRAATPRQAEARELLRRERGYFQANAARMDYPAFQRQGLPIGSGAVESAADHLVQRRMKRAGMRWSDAGGDALLALRARLRSGRPLLLPGPRARPTAPAA
jgi:hypothetical protein